MKMRKLFRTWIDEAGYEIAANAETGDPVISVKAAVEGIRAGRWYELSEQPAAFHRFSAAVEPAAIIEFANDFGLLKHDQVLLVLSSSGHVEPRHCIALKEWQSEREKLRHLIDQLAFTEGGYLMIGLGAKDRIAPLPLLESINPVLRSVTYGEVRNSSSGQLEWMLTAHNMLGALWLQFVDAVVSKKRFQICAECGNPFHVQKASTRFERLYCDARCRARAYRKRSAASSFPNTGAQFLLAIVACALSMLGMLVR